MHTPPDHPTPSPSRLLFPALRWREGTGFVHLEPEIERALELDVGGFILFGGEASRVRALVDSLRARSRSPLLIGSDLERGAGQQFRGCTELPPAWALGSLDDLATVWRAGELTAREARALGVDWVYAPVADLGNEPKNPIVGTRAFGADPDLVAKRVAAWVGGCLAGGAAPCVKHFPGHGRTLSDSHLGLPRVDDPEDVLAQDLVPFAAAVAAGVPSVMSAHVAYPALDPEGRPATRSPRVLGGLLRERLGFEGVVVSDALIMEGASAGSSQVDAALEAVSAGVDALLYPPDAVALAEALERAPADTLPRERIRDAAARLDRMREALPPPPPEPVVEGPRRVGMDRRVWSSEDDRRFARETALKTVTLLRQGAAPLRWPYSLVVIDDDEGGPYPAPPRRTFTDTLRRLGVELVDTPADSYNGSVVAPGSKLVAVFADVRGWKGRVGLSESAKGRLQEALRGGTPALVVLFSHPWNAADIPPEAAVLCAWGGEPLMQEAAARAVARLSSE